MSTSDLFVEPFAGMAGDMFLAALLDLGDPRFTLDDLRVFADALVPGEAKLAVETAWRGNLSGRLLTVATPESEHAPHRGLSDLEALVARSPLSTAARARANAVFRRIAVAEGKVHGCSPEEIHFHEVGAVDTLVDVGGAMLALERLGVARVFASPPLLGSGTVRCAHGLMPVPAPAVAELLRGRETQLGGGGERLTPTGAALLAELCPTFAPPATFVAERVGYGAGHRDPKEGPPNILRVQLGSARAGVARANAWLVEVNLDDMTGEELAHAAEALREAGALDAWTVAATMKKGRPGVVLSALCRAETRSALERVLFERTTTLGVRWREVERAECARSSVDVVLDGARVRVKVRERAGAAIDERDLSPEHDDLAALARTSGRSLRELERAAITLALDAVAARRTAH